MNNSRSLGLGPHLPQLAIPIDGTRSESVRHRAPMWRQSTAVAVKLVVTIRAPRPGCGKPHRLPPRPSMLSGSAANRRKSA